MERKPKASDITDEQIYAVVDGKHPQWATIGDCAEALSEFPWKVVLAKTRQMIAKGRLDGCPCGCRGDFRRVGA